MRNGRSRAWRAAFVVGGLLYLGGVQHPHGRMVDMLSDPAWVRAHVTILAGLLALGGGLAAFRREVNGSPALRRWLGFAIVMTLLEVVEMAVHTVAFVDAGALAAGGPTPVLTTHLWMATLVYTPYAIALIGVIWLGQREGVLGSPWIGWIGMFGAAAHGVVMWLAIVLRIGPAGILFPLALTLGIWFVLAGLWPDRRAASVAATEGTAGSIGCPPTWRPRAPGG